MASNCKYWRGGKCVIPNEGDTGPCTYSGSDFQTSCSVFRLTAAKLAGKGTFEAMQEAGVLSPFGFTHVVGGQRSASSCRTTEGKKWWQFWAELAGL